MSVGDSMCRFLTKVNEHEILFRSDYQIMNDKNEMIEYFAIKVIKI